MIYGDTPTYGWVYVLKGGSLGGAMSKSLKIE